MFAVFILWFFGRNLDWQEVSLSLRRADPFYLALAFIGICLGYFLRAVRWKVLLSPITESSLRELFATTTVGFAAILLVGRAGEIVRPMWLPMRDRRIRPSSALVTIFVERMFDLASLFIFFAISLIWFRIPEGRESEFAFIKLVGNLMLAASILGFAAMFVYHRFSEPVIAWFERFTDRSWVPKRLRALFLGLLRQAAAALDILRSPREIFWVIFWTTNPDAGRRGRCFSRRNRRQPHPTKRRSRTGGGYLDRIASHIFRARGVFWVILFLSW